MQVPPYHFQSATHIHRPILVECLVNWRKFKNIQFAVILILHFPPIPYPKLLPIYLLHWFQIKLKNPYYLFWGSSVQVSFYLFQSIIFIFTVRFINIKFKKYYSFGHFWLSNLFKKPRVIIIQVNANFSLPFTVDYSYLQVNS